MKEIKSFEAELNRTKELGRGVITVDNKLVGLIESQLSVLDDSYRTLSAGARTTRV